MQFRDENLEPLAGMICQLSGVPAERLVGFAVVVAVYEENEDPGGRLISSTPDLRSVQKLLAAAQRQIGGELDKLAGWS